MDSPARTLSNPNTADEERIRIRYASEADLESLEWDGEYTHYRRLFQRAIDEARHGRRILLLAEIEGRLVGQIFVQLATRSTFSAKGVSSGYLYAFRVKQPYRNRGVGSRLLQAAEATLARRGIRRAVISVAKANPAAKRLYERAGYSVFTEDRGEWSYVDHNGALREVKEPAYVLEKWLTARRELNST